jgi:hypothetical protein
MTVAGANESVDRMQAGIIDPTEALIIDIPEAEKANSSMEHGVEF